MSTSDLPDHYELLGVPRTASQSEIKAAWIAAAKRLHPDVGGNAALFRMAKDAYDTLSDQKARAEYDRRQPHGDTAQSEQSEQSTSDFRHPEKMYLGENQRVRDFTVTDKDSWDLLGLAFLPITYLGYSQHEWFPHHALLIEVAIAVVCSAVTAVFLRYVWYRLCRRMRVWHRFMAVSFLLLAVLDYPLAALPVVIEAGWLAFRLLAPVRCSPAWAALGKLRLTPKNTHGNPWSARAARMTMSVLRALVQS